MMYICYIDESGRPDIGSGTSHFVLLGLTIPAERWRACDEQIKSLKTKYQLEDKEIHTGWMTRRYIEQEKIADFDKLSYAQRAFAVVEERKKTLLKIAALKDAKALQEAKKNLRKTEPYIHLTREERFACLRDLCDLIGSWGECRIFADAIDKTSFAGKSPKYPPFEEAFTQVVSRFELFLTRDVAGERLGLLVQDNNETVAARLTNLMQRFHVQGTMFVNISHIIETPLFVSSSLTGMVQAADICAYATRRFFENNENDLFDRIYSRFNRAGRKIVGLRHYTRIPCNCRVCLEH